MGDEEDDDNVEEEEEEGYFHGRHHDHCACRSLAGACANWHGPDWMNPWTGRRLNPNTTTWRRITRHCRHLEGRDNEGYDARPDKPRRKLVSVELTGRATEADAEQEDEEPVADAMEWAQPAPDPSAQYAGIQVPNLSSRFSGFGHGSSALHGRATVKKIRKSATVKSSVSKSRAIASRVRQWTPLQPSTKRNAAHSGKIGKTSRNSSRSSRTPANRRASRPSAR